MLQVNLHTLEKSASNFPWKSYDSDSGSQASDCSTEIEGLLADIKRIRKESAAQIAMATEKIRVKRRPWSAPRRSVANRTRNQPASTLDQVA